MARLRNILTDVVVDVDDETAARMSRREWEPAAKSASTATPKPPAKKPAAKK